MLIISIMTTKHINYHLLRKDPVSIQWDPKIRNTHSTPGLRGWSRGSYPGPIYHWTARPWLEIWNTPIWLFEMIIRQLHMAGPPREEGIKPWHKVIFVQWLEKMNKNFEHLRKRWTVNFILLNIKAILLFCWTRYIIFECLYHKRYSN
jgi:hypothetical protein